MKRAWGAALAVVVVLAVGLALLLGASGKARPVIAYVRGSASAPQVWLADFAGRADRRLGPGQNPLVSPDGSMVAATAPPGSSDAGGVALTLYSTSGGAPQRFFKAARASAVAQAWSQDSRYLAVVLTSTDPASDASSGLAVIDTGSFHYRVVARGPIYGASFAPDGSDRLVYASALGQALAAAVDIHVAAPDGSGERQITDDGRSLNPVWEASGVLFDHERIRPDAAPAYQIWSMRPDGSDSSQLTRLPAPDPLLNGLVPVAASARGGQLLAEYEGQDTSAAWDIGLSARQARPLAVAGTSVVGSALSHNGGLALVDAGGFLNAPDQGTIESVPLGGGNASVLIRHASEPSWDR